MGWSVTGSMVFGAFAAAVQLVIGALLISRNPRNERVALFGLLFLLNGLVAMLTFAGAGFAEVQDNIANNAGPAALGSLRAALFFENCTNFVLLLLAAVYPRRIRLLRHAPHAAILFIGMVAAMLLVRVSIGDVFLLGRRSSWPLTATAATFAYGVFDVAFPFIMLRWAWLWRENMPRDLRVQFGLIFAAIGVRAVHQMIFVPVVEVTDVLDGRAATTAGLAIGGVLVTINAIALVASLVMMVLWTRRLKGPDRNWHGFVWAFLAFGVVEAAVTIVLDRGHVVKWFHALTGDFDVLVIRPVLVWFAITRTHFLDVRLRSGQMAWAMAFLLTAAAVTGGVYEAFGARGAAGVQWALSGLVGVAVASIMLAVLQSMVLVRSEAFTRPPTPTEVYASQLDEAHRNGWPSLAEQTRLAGLRAQLGISDTLHAQLEAKVLARAAGRIGVSPAH